MQYFVLDDFGNVTGTVYDSTHFAQMVSYDDWGDATVVGDTTNRLTWKGRPIDQIVWLTQMRARWYDPVLGRFMSEDPIGLAGGINPYLFANDDPVNGRDPSGMYIGMPDDDGSDPLELLGGHGGNDPEIPGFTCTTFSTGTTTCIAYALPSLNITGRQGPLFGGDEPADPAPTIFAQFVSATGPMPVSNDPKALWARCTEQAVADNAASLGIDVGGALVPEASLLKLGAGIVGSSNALYHSDLLGVAAGSTGTIMDAFEAAAKNGSSIAKAIPFLGNAINLGVFADDIHHTAQSYRSCRGQR